VVLGVVGDKPLPAELVEQIVDKTDGVPLFLEELTKAVRESELLEDLGDRYGVSGKLERLAIPNTLRDSLMARLDRLIPVKEIAQIGAVIGREFSHELVRAVTPMSEAQLDEALERLTASGLVFRRGAGEQATYLFKHALVQDAAYDSLLLGKRQRLHAQIAQAIEARLPEKVRSEPELLAHHYTEAGLLQNGMPYWMRAGQLAQDRVALLEAIGYFQRGLELCLRLEPSEERDRTELRLRALLGIALVALYGYTHPEVARTLEPALRLTQVPEDAEYTMRVLWGIWVDKMCSGETERSRERAEQLMSAADQLRDGSMKLVGHWVSCNSHYFLGNFAQSIQHAEEILSRYDAERDRHIADVVNHDPMTIALAYRAAAQWRIGLFARARASAALAIEHSRKRRHVFDWCWVHTYLSQTMFADAGDTDAIAASLEEAERVAREQKMLFFSEVYCPLARAFSWHWLNRPDQAAAGFERVTGQWTGAGLMIWVPSIKASHAQALIALGDLQGAHRLLEEALAQIQRVGWGERSSLAEILRLKGCILQRSGDASAAESLFRESIQVAVEQGARCWELRTANSLARLLSEQSRRGEAVNVLRAVLDVFGDAGDERDVREASMLLRQIDTQP